MTIGSPSRFFSARRGSVIGRAARAPGDCGVVVDMAAASPFWLAPSGEEGRHLGIDVDDPVAVALDVHDPGLVGLHLRAVVLAVGDDDDRVAAVHEPGRGAVDLHVAGAPDPGDGVRLEAGAVVDVDDVHLLVLEDVGGLEQVRVDGDRADVVQIAVGHRRPVDLGLEHHALHHVLLMSLLSINRVSPTRAATATSTSPSSASTGTKVSGSTSARYSGSTPISRMACSPAARAEARSPPFVADAAAASSPRLSARARRRSSGARRTLRLDSARPSGSRTVSTASTRTPSSRSRTSRRMTASCWASFSPKYATSGRMMVKSLVTTVATPSKWPGRCAPSSASVTPATW